MTDFSKPHCLYVDETMKDEESGQYIPSMIFKDEPGHYPMKGNSPNQAPWRFGDTIEEAKKNVNAISHPYKD